MSIRNKIETVMQGDPGADAGWLGAGLSVAAGLFGLGVRLRRKAYAKGWLKKERLLLQSPAPTENWASIQTPSQALSAVD